MHNGFVSVAREIFPHSIIYIDMFHVIKHLNDCVMRMLVTKQSGIDTKYDQKAPVVKKRAISC